MDTENLKELVVQIVNHDMFQIVEEHKATGAHLRTKPPAGASSRTLPVAVCARRRRLPAPHGKGKAGAHFSALSCSAARAEAAAPPGTRARVKPRPPRSYARAAIPSFIC